MYTIPCPHCGRLNRSSAAFCAGCGTRLGAPPIPTEPPPPQSTPMDRPPAGYTPAPPPPADYPPTPRTVYYPNDQAPGYPLPVDVGYANYGAPPPYPPPASPAQLFDNPFARAAAIFALALFVLLQSLLLPVFYMGWQALNPGVYKRALKNSDFYTRAPLLAAEQLEFSKYVGKNLLCEPLTKEDWGQITNRLATPAWLQAQSEAVIDQFFSQVKGGQNPLRLTFSLAQFNQAVGGGPGFQAYQAVFREKAICSQADLDKVYGYLLETPGSCIPRCKLPPDLLDRDDLPPEIELMAFLWDGTDDAIQFLLEIAAEFLPQSREILIQGDSGGIIPLLRLAGYVYPAAGLLALVSLPLLLGIFLTRSGRSLRGILLGWGIPLALVGAICLLIALAVVIGGPLLLASSLSGAGSDVAPGLVNAIGDIARSVLVSLALPLGLHAGFLLLLGGGMAGAGLLFRR